MASSTPPRGPQQPPIGQFSPGGQPRMAQVPPGQMPPPGAIPIPVQLPNGQQLTPEQMQQIQQQFLAEAARQGLTPQEFSERLRAHAMAQQQARMQAAAQGQGMPGQPGQLPPPGQGGPQGQQQGQQQVPPPEGRPMPPPGAQAVPGAQVPIQPGPPKPEAIELAKFLKSQNLKSRSCIFQEKRKELFKVKRAIRAIQSPAYEKARAKKGSLLPPVTDRASAENVFKLLPISMLALRVAKIDPNNIPHGQPGHVHGGPSEGGAKKKGKKGQLWNVAIVPQQEAHDDFHYIWFYEGSQWKQKAYAALALLAVFAVVMFPLWPYTLRRGVWYLSMGCLGLLGLFFLLAIVRLILFVITVTVGPKPGLWLFPNLFEDVGFFDSFKPLWAWRETKENLAAKKLAKKEKKALKAKKKGKEDAKASLDEASGEDQPVGEIISSPIAAEPLDEEGVDATGAEVEEAANGLLQRMIGKSARIEEVEDDE